MSLERRATSLSEARQQARQNPAGGACVSTEKPSKLALGGFRREKQSSVVDQRIGERERHAADQDRNDPQPFEQEDQRVPRRIIDDRLAYAVLGIPILGIDAVLFWCAERERHPRCAAWPRPTASRVLIPGFGVINIFVMISRPVRAKPVDSEQERDKCAPSLVRQHHENNCWLLAKKCI